MNVAPFNVILRATAIALVLVVCPPVDGQDQLANATDKTENNINDDPKVRLVTTLNSGQYAMLGRGQRLQTKVPDSHIDSLQTLRLRTQDRLNNKSTPIQAKTVFDRGKLFVELESRHVERLRYQPIEITVDSQNVRRVVYIVVANKAKDKSQNFRADYYFKMNSGEIIGVKIPETPKIRLKSSVGWLDIDLEKVNGLLLPRNKDGHAIIVFKNGDRLTGKLEFPERTDAETRWGPAKINFGKIFAITRHPDAKFVLDHGDTGNHFFPGTPISRTPTR